MPDYDLVADATDFLVRRTPAQRHAIARLLNVDGEALAVLRWIVEQPDCDLATAAMTFWRVRSLPPSGYASGNIDLLARDAVLQAIASSVLAGRYVSARIAWDGREAWERTPLIGAAARDAAAPDEGAIPSPLFGPFGTQLPEPARHAFFDSISGADDDIFDSLWRHGPVHVAVVDWLEGRSADIRMSAIDDLRGGHNSDIYEWMVLQPDCPASVAGKVFWILEPSYAARYLLEGSDHRPEGAQVLDVILRRWKAGDLAPTDLDFRAYADPRGYRALLDKFSGRADPLEIPPGLLDPPKGREPEPLSLDGDFDYWRAITDLASSVPRPRSAALAAWERAKLERAEQRTRERDGAEAAARPPGTFERLIYGEKFTGTPSQIDRAWRGLNVVSIAGAAVALVMWRAGAPTQLTFVVFVVLLAVVSAYQSIAEIGGGRRMAAWWAGVFAVAMALAALFRWIDR